MIAIDLTQGWAEPWDLPWQTLATQGFAQGILSGLLALAAYSYAVTVLGASKASAFVSLTPALTAFIAAVSLGEWPDGIAVAGDPGGRHGGCAGKRHGIWNFLQTQTLTAAKLNSG